MNFDFSIKKYLGLWAKFIISYVSVIVIFAITTNIQSDPLWSYATLAIACLFGLWLYYYLVLDDIGFSGFWIVLLAFMLKLVVGTWHFVALVQPKYFNGDTTYSFFNDYFWMHDSISYLAIRAREVGFHNALDLDYFILNKGAIIFYLYSPIYYFGGDLVLNISHLSALFTLFTAILTTYMAKSLFCLNRSQLRVLLILTSFYPFGLIISAPMRDFAGQFLIAMGMLSLQFSFKNKRFIMLLIIASVLFFLQRKVYVIIPLFTYLFFLIFKKSELGIRNFNLSFIFQFLIIILFTLFGFKIYSIATEVELFDSNIQLNSSYTADISKFTFYLFFPLFLLKGILGAFPWTQFFEYTEESIYQIIDYFLSTFLFTTIIITWIKWSVFKNIVGKLNSISVASLIIALFGIASGYMHLAYIALPVVFFLPILVQYTSFKFFVRIYILVFIFLILLSFLWIAFGFHGKGIWLNFKY